MRRKEIHKRIKIIASNIEISARELAYIYARTIPYGMLAARLYGGPAPEKFARDNITEWIPLSYPFLKKLFQYLAGEDLDEYNPGLLEERGEICATEPIIKFMKQAVSDCRSSLQSGSAEQSN